MALFGLCFVVFGLWASIDSYGKAERYARLQAEHQRKRQAILSQLRSQQSRN